MTKIKEKLSNNINVFLGTYPLCHIPPAKLCYVLIVHTKSRGWSANQSHTTGHITTEKEISNTVDGWSKQNFFLIIIFFLFSTCYYILLQNNYFITR